MHRIFMRAFSFWGILLSFQLLRISAAEPPSTHFLDRVSAEAWRIHRSALLIDGHNDLPWEMRTQASLSFEEVDIAKPVPTMHTDIGRLKRGGMGAQFWAAYVPPTTLRTGGAARQTLEQIDFIHRMVARYPETFAFARTADEIVRIHQEGRIACLIGIEGGHAIENSLALLRMYHQLGVRYMTLTHSDSLDWADAATDKPKSNGLSDFGRDVVREMNRLGMLVDISHVAPATMHAALDVSAAPIIASHSSAFGVAAHPRNIPDDVLVRLKQNGGVVMVNFYSGFIVPEAAKVIANIFEVSRQTREQFPKETDYQKAMREWRKANPTPAGTVKDLVNHIDHIVKVAGIEHVGLGSDYDGVTQLPVDLPDVSSYPVITQELLNRGYAEGDIRKILGGNILRVLRTAEKVAGQKN
ncbi:MAG: dipeptidase [Verrucomicrobiota bacterium]